MSDSVGAVSAPLLALDEVKQHLNVDFPDDDALIQTYMAAAETAVRQYCNLDGLPDGAEPAFRVAALMVVSDLYDERNGESSGIPAAAKQLIDPYRLMRV